MIIKEITSNAANAKNVLVICGTHGDETTAIKTCWDLYNRLCKKELEYPETGFMFVFMANENAVRYNERCYQGTPENGANLNRAFAPDEKPFESVVKSIKNLITNYKPNVVIDVHNSPTCNDTVLIDYGPGSFHLYNIAEKFDLNPMVRQTQNFGTIKRYCIEKNIVSFTVEMAPMFNEFHNNTSFKWKYVRDVINAGLELDSQLKEQSNCPLNSNLICDPGLVTSEIYCPFPSAIVEWVKEDPYMLYEKGELICNLTDMETQTKLEIIAPCKLKVQDICCPDVAFEGYSILEYSPKV